VKRRIIDTSICEVKWREAERSREKQREAERSREKQREAERSEIYLILFIYLLYYI
jgi:hypothetical protein